jgi:hypothetical protein
MSYIFYALIAAAAVLVCMMAIRRLTRRVRGLERELQSISGVMSEIAEIQMKTYAKHSANLESLEERIMELSVPSPNPELPLERRHQVLALARQGVSLEDIVRRVKAPVGEAELILNLRKQLDTENPRAAKVNQQVGQYA